MKLIKAFTLYGNAGLSDKQQEIRDIALNSFEAFIRLVAPYQLLGHCHVDLCKWIQANPTKNKLVLWPRDHGKSRMAAFYACWEICRDPSITIIYASATAEKAEEQLRFVRTILSSKIVLRYFPGLVHPQEGQREEWNRRAMIVDHQHREKEGVVDSTVMTAGVGKTITGKHCKILILDDIVVPENNTEIGRRDVNSWVAQAASIMSGDATIFAVGTRYHPKDAYEVMMNMRAEYVGTDDNEEVETEDLFVVNQHDVEVGGDFLWPRHQRKDGKWFGFDSRILARKRAVYEAAGEITQFYAQYYNDPNDKSTAPIARDLFQYYSKEDLSYMYGTWSINGTDLYCFAAVDLSASIGDRRDYTVVIVGGIDLAGNRYVLDIERYQSDKSSLTIDTITRLFSKYHFKKLRIEAVAGFKLVAQDMHEALQKKGIRVPTDFYTPAPNESKIVRVNNILEPLYQSRAVYHYRGGKCQQLEDELVSLNPANDDTKDAWAMCCDLMEVPLTARKTHATKVLFHPRWGGVI